MLIATPGTRFRSTAESAGAADAERERAMTKERYSVLATEVLFVVSTFVTPALCRTAEEDSVLRDPFIIGTRQEYSDVTLKPYRTVPARRLDGDSFADCTENLAVESVLEVSLGKESLAAFVCSPGFEEELTLGYLLSTGVVTSPSSILNVRLADRTCTIEMKPGENARLDRDFSQLRRSTLAGCSASGILVKPGTGGSIPSIRSEITVSLEQLVAAQTRLFEKQELFHKTHGTHAAFIGQVDSEEYSVAEDIGRHNAIDKAIGIAAKKGLDLGSTFLLFTGRLTADVVTKCAWASIPLVASYSAATDAGVTFAKKANITMMGMFRGKRAKIYNVGAATIRF